LTEAVVATPRPARLTGAATPQGRSRSGQPELDCFVSVCGSSRRCAVPRRVRRASARSGSLAPIAISL